jgi:hypothetical protein
VVSLLCYSLCVITVLTAVAGAMIGLFISTSERMGHAPHPRPPIERDDMELRLFMVVPNGKYGMPAKNTEARSAAVSGEKGDAKKASLAREKRSLASTTTTNDRAMETRAMTPDLGAGQVAYFQLVTQIGDNSRPV